MVRPRKKRRIGHKPEKNFYEPKEDKFVHLGYEELEAIRLMDYKGMTQQEASELMNVGRTTLQSIYKEAREKVATALVENLKIQYKDNECYEFYVSKGPGKGRGRGRGRGMGCKQGCNRKNDK